MIDLEHPSGSKDHLCSSIRANKELFSAGGKTTPSHRFDADPECLITKGAVVFSITALSLPYPDVHAPAERIWHRRYVRDWMRYADEGNRSMAEITSIYMDLVFHGQQSWDHDLPVSERDVQLFKTEWLCHQKQRFRWRFKRNKSSNVQRFTNVLAFATLTCHNKCFAMTSTGRFCLVPATTRKDDVIVILKGCPLPIVTRSIIGVTSYRLVGNAYLHGAMKGEMVSELESRWTNITIA